MYTHEILMQFCTKDFYIDIPRVICLTFSNQVILTNSHARLSLSSMLNPDQISQNIWYSKIVYHSRRVLLYACINRADLQTYMGLMLMDTNNS